MQLFTQDDIRHIAALGAVPSWTVPCALAGYIIRIYWPDSNTVAAARETLSDAFDTLLRQGKVSVSAIGAARARVYFTDDPSDALLDAQFVAAVHPDKALVRMVDTYVSPRAVVCCAGLNERHLEGSRHPERWMMLVNRLPEPLPGTAPRAFETARMLYLSFFPSRSSLQ